MKLCAVQLASRKGDLAGNLHRHLHAIEQAAAAGAELVVFPELSLSGYHPSLAGPLASVIDTATLAPVQALCQRLGVHVALGLPLLVPAGVQIGMQVLRPDTPPLHYAKQRLHADEVDFFVPGEQSRVFSAGELRLGPAICYESMFVEHAEHAKAQGAQVYLVSVAKTAQGIREGYAHYAQVARQLHLPVLMANCVGPAEHFVGAGQSAAWDAHGQRLASLDAQAEGLLLFDTLGGSAEAHPLALAP